MKSVLLAGIAVIFALSSAAAAQAQPVRLKAGPVEGTTENGLGVYKGIPFAAPPVGALRWRPPQPVKPWTQVRAATKFADACPQDRNMLAFMGMGGLGVSEDCLYLNVWTPAHTPGEKLPVMVWIYGGGFSSGATGAPLYDGSVLARHGVIVVTIAYRVGAFGFMAHPQLSAESPVHSSGNYGLEDQIAALKWVKANIAAFGGDPERVTLFGESAGAISVSMLAASPETKGLFQRAISESGGSFAPLRTGSEGGENVPPLAVAEAQGAAFLKRLGATSLTEARKLPVDAILQASGPMGTFWPNADGHIIIGDQYRLYQQGRYNDIPVLIGTNDDEGALFVQQATAAGFKAGLSAYGDHAGKILAAYPANDDAQALQSARDLFRDSAFAWHTWAWADLQSQTGKSPVYAYYFTHKAPDMAAMLHARGAPHASEIAYVFGHEGQGWTADDRKVSNLMIGYWTNFAKTGNPNGDGLPAWPAYRGDGQMMHLDSTPGPIGVPNLPQLQALDGYYAWRRSSSH